MYLSTILKKITWKEPVKTQGSRHHKNDQILKDKTTCDTDMRQIEFSHTAIGGYTVDI